MLILEKKYKTICKNNKCYRKIVKTIFWNKMIEKILKQTFEIKLYKKINNMVINNMVINNMTHNKIIIESLLIGWQHHRLTYLDAQYLK